MTDMIPHTRSGYIIVNQIMIKTKTRMKNLFGTIPSLIFYIKNYIYIYIYILYS